MLNPFHMLQVVDAELEVSHCPDGDRNPIVTRSNPGSSFSRCHSPSRIGDTFDCRINVFNPIQVGYLIKRINSTGACQIGRRGFTEAKSLQHRPDRVNCARGRRENKKLVQKGESFVEKGLRGREIW
jgi:hypothetical protein